MKKGAMAILGLAGIFGAMGATHQVNSLAGNETIISQNKSNTANNNTPNSGAYVPPISRSAYAARDIPYMGDGCT